MPTKVLLPILYSACHIFSRADWVQSTFLLSTLPQDPMFEVVSVLPPRHVLFFDAIESVDVYYPRHQSRVTI